MSINNDILEHETMFDGVYAYDTSLDDDAVDVLRARSFHQYKVLSSQRLNESPEQTEKDA